MPDDVIRPGRDELVPDLFPDAESDAKYNAFDINLTHSTMSTAPHRVVNITLIDTSC